MTYSRVRPLKNDIKLDPQHYDDMDAALAAAGTGSGGATAATFSRLGILIVGAGVSRFPFPAAATITGVILAVGTAPTGTTSTPISGASLVVDVNKNGTTIFTTQANRPHIQSGVSASPSSATPDVTSFAAGDYLTVDVDFVGSTVAGADLTVQVAYQ